jgi:hypothetical protein
MTMLTHTIKQEREADLKICDLDYAVEIGQYGEYLYVESSKLRELAAKLIELAEGGSNG